MSNWCVNSLKITGPYADLVKVLHPTVPVDGSFWEPDGSVEAEKIPGTLALDIPLMVPEGDVDLAVHLLQDPLRAREFQVITGPKREEPILELAFDTAGNPPLGEIEALSRLYPELVFMLRYSEPMMDFQGEYLWQAGKILRKGEGRLK